MKKILSIFICFLLLISVSGCGKKSSTKTILCTAESEAEDAYEMKSTMEIKYSKKDNKLDQIIQKVEMKFDKDNDNVKENFDEYVEMQEENFKKYEDEYKGVKIDYQVDKKKYTMSASITVDAEKADEDTFEMTELQDFIDEDKIFDLDAFWDDYEENKDNSDFTCKEK